MKIILFPLFVHEKIEYTLFFILFYANCIQEYGITPRILYLCNQNKFNINVIRMKKSILIAALGLFSLSTMAQDAKPEEGASFSRQ